MTTFTVGKPSPNKNDMKNASVAMKSRQQVINEVNKKRTLLQDNSWIKKRPEEENADENYGRVVLNQYKSQDGLNRSTDEKDDQKALLSRYRSDTTLDRIPGNSDADKANELPTLDGKPSSRKALDASINTGNATSPVKKKRQSWMPPPVSSQKVTIDDEQHKRHSWASQNTTAAVATNNKPVPATSNKGGGPKITIYSSEPITSPGSNAATSDPARTRQICPAKPSEPDANKTMTKERAERGQELDDLIDVKTKGNKNNQGSQELDNHIQVKTKSDKGDKGHQDLDDFIKVNRTANGHAKGDLDDLIAVNNTPQKIKRSQELDDLIVVKSSPVDQNKKWAPEQDHESASIPGGLSEMNHLYQETRGSSRFPHEAYEDNIPGKSIKTVYSTSDRAVIEKEMCTYCRKPLGTDTKMILDALQICCHATCFKCEVCKAPLENVKAGDSIWIYRNTVHCEPCYSTVKSSWAY